MATTQITIDDLDGTVDAEPFHFEVDGDAYVIDLGPKNKERFRKAVTPFIEAATLVRPARTTRRSRKGEADRGFDIAKLRRWADEHSVNLPSRGRIPAHIVAEYKAAGGK